MLVNHSQIAYVLGISITEAKLMMFPHISRFKGYPIDDFKKVKLSDEVESSLLGAVFHHPSPMLDGKDKIEYIMCSLHKNVGLSLKKRIVEDNTCLRQGKIAGKYRPLLRILNKDDINTINSIIKKRREIFLESGGSFKCKKGKSRKTTVNNSDSLK